jgi:hypothetical protein
VYESKGHFKRQGPGKSAPKEVIYNLVTTLASKRPSRSFGAPIASV